MKRTPPPLPSEGTHIREGPCITQARQNSDESKGGESEKGAGKKRGRESNDEDEEEGGEAEDEGGEECVLVGQKKKKRRTGELICEACGEAATDKTCLDGRFILSKRFL